MKVGDLVKAWEICSGKSHIGVIIKITTPKLRYKVFFPNPPKPWWNEGDWNKKVLVLV